MHMYTYMYIQQMISLNSWCHSSLLWKREMLLFTADKRQRYLKKAWIYLKYDGVGWEVLSIRLLLEYRKPAREQDSSEMWRGIQSLCLLLYSEHVPSPLHLSVLSNNSPLLAACLPASLVNHAVFASDLARIVAGLYVYAVRLHKRTETF